MWYFCLQFREEIRMDTAKTARANFRGLWISLFFLLMSYFGTYTWLLVIAQKSPWYIRILTLPIAIVSVWVVAMIVVRVKRHICYTCSRRLYPLIHFGEIVIDKEGIARCIHCDFLSLKKDVEVLLGTNELLEEVSSTLGEIRLLSRHMEKLLLLK